MTPTTFTTQQKSQARKELKAIGYNLKIHSHASPFSGTRFEFASFIKPDGQVVRVEPDCSCYGVDFYNQHKQAFEIIIRCLQLHK